MKTRTFVAVEFFRNNRGRLEFVDAFSVTGVRSAKALLKEGNSEPNTEFAVYEVVDGGLVKFE